MADAVILSQETYDRIMKVVEAWEEGELPLIMGEGMKLEEVGPTGMKIGVDLNDIGPDQTLELDVCVDGSPETHTFVIVK